MEFNLVVCIDTNFGIAKNGKIPWSIKEDSDYFRDLIKTKTNGKQNVIVSGRKTFEQMGLIKDHHNIVFTRDVIGKDSIIQVHSMEEFMKEIESIDYGKIFICGGSEIYNLFTGLIGKDGYTVNLYLNLINNNFECDVFIPDSLKKYCSIIGQSINPQIQEQVKNGLGKLLGEYLPIFDFTEKNIENKMLVQNLVDKNYFEFVRFYPCRLTLNGYEYLQTQNMEEQKYLDLMKDLLLNGTKTQTRNGYTYAKFGTTLEFDLKNGFPLLTTKKMFFKGVCEELLFFLRGNTDSKRLSERGVKIWEKNTDRTFLDSLGFTNREEGDLGPMYGFQWLHFNAPYNGCNEDYNGKGVDQLSYVLNELRTNPNSRRIIMTTYNPSQAKDGVLFPCHGISIQFNVEETEDSLIVNLSQNQRSADYFLGLPFNIASYALLLELVCHQLNSENPTKRYIPGKVVLFLGDYHIYETHRDQCVKQIQRYPLQFPKIKLNSNKKLIDEFEFEDFEIINYNSYPGILAEMVA
jgi:dihydrofolate reductase/thymidylate synthase